jgi:hypothetical protein
MLIGVGFGVSLTLGVMLNQRLARLAAVLVSLVFALAFILVNFVYWLQLVKVLL